eukprot:TRINITY_DN4080_c0_g1_i3.p1 TRINITY_DN4080_c0_g1~~TRINITY_DN4080_c0_g1_i3.p1  ORF type:complete len:356 (+),score=97.55 TRINITY_DN4080_c0_g1_i3:1562-2629(+)
MFVDSDLLQSIFKFLTAEELGDCVGLVNRTWYKVSLRNALWDRLCETLWFDKSYIPKRIVHMKEKLREGKRAYVASLMDSRRTFVSKDELCGFNWSFRFKLMAGSHFTEHDPYWNGLQTRKVFFGEDGKVHYGGFGDFTRDWKFVHRAAGRAARKEGNFVRVGEFPAYIVSRHPVNWGFIMQSCWVVLTSFEMPPPGSDPLLEDDNLDITVENQWFEASRYNANLEQVEDVEVETSWGQYLRRNNFVDSDSGSESEVHGDGDGDEKFVSNILVDEVFEEARRLLGERPGDIEGGEEEEEEDDDDEGILTTGADPTTKEEYLDSEDDDWVMEASGGHGGYKILDDEEEEESYVERA